MISASRLDGDSALQVSRAGLLRRRLLAEHRQVALLLEVLDRVVQRLAHRPELEPQVPELLVRHLVRLLPRVHLVRAPAPDARRIRRPFGEDYGVTFVIDYHKLCYNFYQTFKIYKLLCL